MGNLKRKWKVIFAAFVVLAIAGTMCGCLDTRSDWEKRRFKSDYFQYKEAADKYVEHKLNDALADFLTEKMRKGASTLVPLSIFDKKAMEELVKNEVKNCEWQFDKTWLMVCNPVPCAEHQCVFIYDGIIEYELLNQTCPVNFHVYIIIDKGVLGNYFVKRVRLDSFRIGEQVIGVGEYLYKRPKAPFGWVE